MFNDLNNLKYQFGGEWCDCINEVFDKVTPQKLASYCISKGYKECHPTVRDFMGVRYSYFLDNRVQTVLNSDNVETTKQFYLVAAFGDFDKREYDTAQSCLQAITNIAKFEKRPAHQIALDVIAADPEVQPDIKDETNSPGEGPPMMRRFQQNSTGNMPI